MCAFIDIILNMVGSLLSVAAERLVKTVWDNLLFWRLFSLALLAAIISALLLKQKIVSVLRKEDIVNHDRDCFRHLDSIMNERRLNDFLSEVDASHRYWVPRNCSSPNQVLFRLVIHYEEQSNKFNIRKLDKVCNKLLITVDEFTTFISRNFFVEDPVTEAGHEMVLRSEWTIDRGATQEQIRRYAEVARRLEKYVDELRRDYRIFRKAVRTTLFI